MSTLTATARLAAKNDLARLIDDLMAFIRRYCVVTDHERLIIAVWIIHTYCIGPDEPFQTPYLNITSPVPGSGKSLLLRLLKVLAKDVQLAASISGAAMKRMIDEEAPVLLIDELDAFLGGNKERAETVRGILNSGFERDGRFIDCKGPQHTRRNYKTFCPKAFAGLGKYALEDSTHSRCIPIAMKRKRRDEIVGKFRERKVRAQAEPLIERLPAIAARIKPELEKDEDPYLPESLEGREQDVVEPLVKIADVAGDDYGAILREAVVISMSDTSRSDNDHKLLLLRDIRQVYPMICPDGESLMPTNPLLDKLYLIPESPWSEWKIGKPMTSVALAAMLKEFNIVPISDGRRRGYDVGQFRDVWHRYLAEDPSNPSTRQETNQNLAKQGNVTHKKSRQPLSS